MKLAALPARRYAAAVVLLGVPVLGVFADDPRDEIVVTARKLEESATSVPLSIGVLRADDLDENGAADLAALGARIPGVYSEASFAGFPAYPTLRSQTQNPTGDLAVGVFVDGVYQAHAAAIDSAPVDVERVEVVRGPQSALFGHSTFAGAIHYVSRSPTSALDAGSTLDAGSDGYRGASGYVSGPVRDGALRVRAAFAAHDFDGRWRSADGIRLGGFARTAASFGLATPPSDGFAARATVRLAETRASQPPVAALTYSDYNCGAIEAASQAWSYYCGALPLDREPVVSAGIPRSDVDVAQGKVALSWPLAGGRLESETSAYHARSDGFRDFDLARGGAQFGVCVVGESCGTASTSALVNRIVAVDELARPIAATREWSEEIRWRATRHRVAVLAGLAAWRTSQRSEDRFAAARGDLAPNERLTALLPSSPTRVGPESLVNSALVAEPTLEQALRGLDFEERRSFALFGAADVLWRPNLTARFELRLTRERKALTNVVANFAPGFGTAIPPQRFADATPRVALSWSPTERWNGYASAAKGSRSGGINPIPGLLPHEQTYAAEYNWTYETGVRFRGAGGRLDFDGTIYRIDWRDAQLTGFPTTPGVANLITLNAAGFRTTGFEVSVVARPHDRVELDLGWAEADAAFSAGSDDAGSRRFCGLSGRNETSSFCTIGPSRTGLPGASLVPYVDGNVPPRVPMRTWHAGVYVALPAPRDARLGLYLDANGQDDVFERAINGARFGARTLLDARFVYAVDRWSVQLWGRNLRDERYVRSAISRGQVFFPTTPRPIDIVYAEGRRLGVSVSRGFGSPESGLAGASSSGR